MTTFRRRSPEIAEEPAEAEPVGPPATMREMAQEFVAHTREAGWSLGWEPSSVVELDRFITQIGPADASMIASHLGAYFGELLVRNGAGRWTLDDDVMTCTGYALSPQGAVERRACDPAAPALATVYVFAMVGHPTLEEAEPDFGRDVNARMRTWAAIFTHDAALHGMFLDYDEESLDHVESMCEVLHCGNPDRDAIDELALTMGAYLGEVVISTSGGTWALDEAENALAVDLPSGVRCYPLQQVARRLGEGADHDLRLFHCLVAIGAMADGCRHIG